MKSSRSTSKKKPPAGAPKKKGNKPIADGSKKDLMTGGRQSSVRSASKQRKASLSGQISRDGFSQQNSHGQISQDNQSELESVQRRQSSLHSKGEGSPAISDKNTLGIKEVPTRGENLNQVVDEIEFARTEQLKAGQDGFFDERDPDIFTNLSRVRKTSDVHDVGEIGFMDEYEDIQPVNTVDVTEEKIAEIQASWAIAKALGVDTVGKLLMRNIFKIEPTALQLYSFKNVSDLYESKELKSHYTKLIGSLNSVIESLADPKDIGKTMKELGRRHVDYGVKVEHYNVIGKAILNTLDTLLQDQYTSSIKHAWIAFIRQVASQMISDNYELPKSPKKPLSLSPEVESQIIRSWSLVRKVGLDPVGKLLFKNIFAIAPEALKLYSFKQLPNMMETDEMRGHYTKLLTYIDKVVESIQNQQKDILPILRALGKRHVEYEVIQEHYGVVGKALIQALTVSLKEQFTQDIQEAWSTLFLQITNSMVGDHYKVHSVPYLELSAGSKHEITESWLKVKELGYPTVGPLLMRNIFTIEPEALQLYSFRNEKDLFESEVLKKHYTKLLGSMDKIIMAFDSQEQIEPYIKALGLRHVKYGVIKHHYNVIGKALISTLEIGLKEAFTPRLKQHWIKLFQQITSLMIDDHYDNLAHLDKSIQIPEDAKFQVFQTWQRVKDAGLEEVGQILMKNIFAIAPEALKLYSFKDVPNLFESSQLKNHHSKLTHYIDQAVQSLYTSEIEIVPVLKALGKRHKTYGVIPEHYPIVGQALIQTLKSELQAKMTKEAEKAWGLLYEQITKHMISDNYIQTEVPSLKLADGIISDVQESWQKVKGIGLEPVGRILMKNIFTLAPEALQLYSFRNVADLYTSPELKKHAGKLLGSLDKVVTGLREPEALEPVLKRLGERHVGYGVFKFHYDIIGEAVIKTLEAGLGDQFTADLKASWLAFYSKVKDLMIGDAYEGFSNADKVLQLAQDRRFWIIASWERVKAIGIDPVGKLLMKNIFTIQPESLQLYSFREVPNLYESEELRKHYNKLLGGMDKVVQSLKDPSMNIAKVLQNLGKRHVNYGVSKSHYSVVGRALITTLIQGLGDNYNQDVENAWALFYVEITKMMVRDNYKVKPDPEIQVKSTLKQEIQSSWAKAKGLGIDPVGKLLMKNIFTLAPNALQLYSFKDVDNLYESPELKKHYSKLLGALDKVIASLDNLKAMQPILKAMGKRHVRYGVTKTHYDVIGEAVLLTLETGLREEFTPELKSHWVQFYGDVKAVMIDDNYDGFNKLGFALQLNDDHRFQVVASWEKVKALGLDPVGREVMRNIFTFAPEAMKLYSFKDVPQLYESEELKKHFTKLLSYVDQAVESLKDPEMDIYKALKDLGKRHVGYEVVEEHYNVVGRALIQTLANGLGDEFTEEVQGSWVAFFQEVSQIMISDHYSDEDCPCFEVSAEVVNEIQNSWEQVKQIGIDPVGKLLMQNIFAIEPLALQLYSFRNEEDLYESESLKKHYTKLLGSLDKVINSLENQEGIQAYVKSLGKRHVRYGVIKKHYNVIGNALIATLQTGLGDKFTSELKSSWINFYAHLSRVMMGDHYEGFLNIERCIQLQDDKRFQVVQSWNRFRSQGVDHVGKILMRNIFSIAPQALQLYSFKDVQDLFHSRELRRHYKKLVGSMDQAVESLKDPSININQILQNLGKRHVGYGVEKSHYNIFGRALITSLIEGLGDDYTPEVENSWVLFFVEVTNRMISNLYTPKKETITLSDDAKSLVRESWQDAKDLGIDTVGLLLMKNIFRLKPDALQLYSFRDTPKLYQSEELKQHYTKLITALDKIVMAIDQDPASIAVTARALGHRHVSYGVVQEHYDIVGQALFETLESGLKEGFTPEIKEAWTQMYSEVVKLMIHDHYEAFDDPERALQMTGEEKFLIFQSWEKIKIGFDIVGVQLMKNIFTIAPEAIELYSFKDVEELYRSPELKKHYTKLLSSLDKVIQSMKDPKADVVQTLRDLGKRHLNYGVAKQHYLVVRQALIGILTDALEDEFTDELAMAWNKFYDQVEKHMIHNHYLNAHGPQLEISPLLKKTIRESWNLVKKLGIDPVGRLLMNNIFSIAPDALQLYSFRNIDDLYKSQELRKHYLKLIGSLDKVISGLDNLQEVQKTLKALGKRHVRYGVFKMHYDVIGQALLLTLEQGLKQQFTPELKDKWTDFYREVKKIMISDNYEAFLNIEKCIQLGDDKRFQVIQSWERVKTLGLDTVGPILMKNIFTIAPEALQLYSFKDVEDLYKSEELKKHYTKLLNSVGKVVESLKDPTVDAVSILSDLGKRHKNYGVEKSHYSVVGRALITTLIQGLGDRYTPEVENAWVLFYVEITNHMVGSHYDNPGRIIKLSQDVVDDVVFSWGHAKDMGLEMIGNQLMRNIFRVSPTALQLYSFKSADDLYASPELAKHSKKLLTALDQMIDSIGDPQKLLVTAKALGQRHVGYGVTPDYHYDVIGQAVMMTLEYALEDSFTHKIHGSWQKFFEELRRLMTSDHFEGLEKPKELFDFPAEAGEVVYDTWDKAKQHFDQVGVTLMRNIFSIAPEALQLYSFKDVDDLYNSEELKKHYTKLLKSLDAVVISLKVPYDNIVVTLRKLGERHQDYGVVKEHYNVVGRAIIATLDETFGEQFTSDVKDCWIQFIQRISQIMISDLYEEEEESLIKIDEETAQTIHSSWAEVKALGFDTVGKVLMKEIFTAAPDALQLYSFRDVEDLYESEELKKHYNKLLGSIDKVVMNLDNIPAVEHTLKMLGQRHVKYGVIKTHYNVIGKALLTAFDICLQDGFTDTIRNAWVNVYGQISRVMIGDHYEGFMNIEKQIQLTDDKKFQIFVSWQRTKSLGIDTVGKILMRNIFTIEPKALQLYSFRNVEDLYESKELKQHYTKLIKALDSVVEGMKDPSINISEYLSKLGGRHKEYGVVKDHYNVIGRALIATLVEGLGDHYTPEVENAWVFFYIEITNHMIANHYEKRIDQLMIVLSDEQIKDIQDSWEDVKDLGFETVGPLVMKAIFSLKPDALQLYSFRDIPKLFQSDELKNHYTKLLTALDKIIYSLDTDQQSIRVTAKALGQRHVSYGVAQEHYFIVGQALISVMEENLEHFTPEIKETWHSLYDQLSHLMVQDHYEGFQEADKALQLTGEEKFLIYQSWEKISFGINLIGGTLMKNIFTIAPEALQLYSFRDVKNLYGSEELKKHYTKLLTSLGNVIQSMKDPKEDAVLLLKKMGKRHLNYGVLPEHYPVVRQALLMVLQEAMEHEFTDQVASAWNKFYDEVEKHMISDHYNKVQGFRFDIPVDTKALVYEQWQDVKKLGIDPVGKLLMKNIFSLAPEALQLYSFRNEKDLFESQVLRKHYLKLIGAVDKVIASIDNLGEVEKYCNDLGKRHIRYGVIKKHYEVVGQALLKTLEQGLKNKFTRRYQLAWTKFYSELTKVMVGDHYEAFLNIDKCIQLMDDKRFQVIQSWEKVKTIGIDPVGKILMKNIFTIAPEALQLYSFKDVENLYESPELKKHYTKLITYMDKAVESLKDPEVDIIKVLSDLGKRHLNYGVLKDHYAVVGRALISTLIEGLGKDYTPEVENAWVLFYVEITNHMVSNHYQKGNELVYLSSEVSSDVEIVWTKAMALGIDFVGENLMKNIFKIAPSALQLYSFKSVDEIYSNPDFQMHFKKLVTALDKLVKSRNDPDQLMVTARALGQRHVSYGVSPDFHYEVIGEAVFETLKSGLKMDFTTQLQQSWKEFFGQVHKAMTSGHFEGLRKEKKMFNMSAQEIKLATEAWGKAKLQWDEMGVELFRNLFEIDPLLLQLYSFREEADLYSSAVLKKHYDKVLGVIDKVVISLKIPYGDTVANLQELGRRHKEYGVEKDHYKTMNRALIETFDVLLDEYLAIDIKDSVIKLFEEITSTMMGSLYDESDETIPEKQKMLVIRTWKMAKELGFDTIGPILMRNIFTIAPEALQLYSFKDVEDLYNSEELKKHYTKLITSLDTAISNLSDKKELDKQLNSLGFRHFSYGVKQDHYDVVGKALMNTLDAGLGKKMTPEVKKAWEAAYQYIKEKMIGLNYEPCPHLNLKLPIEVRFDVMSSWEDLKRMGIDPVGKLLFRNFFTVIPEAVELYSFKNVERMYHSKEMKLHYTKLIDMIDQVVKALDDEDTTRIESKIRKLGKRHLNYGVSPEQYPLFMKAIFMTCEAAIRDKFDEDVQESWKEFFKALAALMQCDYYDKIQVIEETREETDWPLGTEHPKEEPKLTESQLKIVRTCWTRVLKDEDLGIKIFSNLFEINPESLELFPFKNIKNYKASHVFKTHANKVVSAISRVVNNIHQVKNLDGTLIKLGDAHIPRKVTPLHFELLNTAIQFTFEEVMGDEYTEEVKEAWSQTFLVVSHKMQENFDYKKYQDLHMLKSQSSRASERVSVGGGFEPQTPGTAGLMDTSKRGLLGEENADFSIAGKEPRTSLKRDLSNQSIIQKEVKQYYKARFQEEVDFHHKISYRFEKAYRLNLSNTGQKKRQLNLEIIDCISDFSGYIEQDPMALFYCLYFCIYYSNAEMVEFLRDLVQRVPQRKKIDQLLEYIDIHGIERLRQVGEQINSMVYHMVFYQAVDDNLRVVYAQIFQRLRFIQLRDVDALQFLNQRDYELIRESFEKYTTKINLLLFYKKATAMKSSTYRKYNQAYYEEIVINNKIEPRVAQNYRERFLVTAEDIYIVFEMYCKEDYDEQFQKTQKSEITHKQFIDLFILCIRNDSFKIATLIYVCYLNPVQDIDERIIDIFMQGIKESIKYHELKLFFLHEHFDLLSVSQMNQLVDIYQDILGRKDPKMNPMISQFNTIKITLLVYRICWKIQEKQIYSLITKCSVLENYLIQSISRYFELQNSILILHKFMSEPILHMTERKDSLDIMYEMSMQQLLHHPVVVEVLNLVYEGKYSVSSSPLSMIGVFSCLFDTEVTSLKSLTHRLGVFENKKQSSLQYHIWKQSIEQREQDEMIFTVLINFFILGFALAITLTHNNSYDLERDAAVISFSRKLTATDTEDFCLETLDTMQSERVLMIIFTILIFVNSLGYLASVVQKILTHKFKDNVTLEIPLLLFEASIFLVGVLYFFTLAQSTKNTKFTEFCDGYLDPGDVGMADDIFSLRNALDDTIDFKLVLSAIIFQACISSILMLQRTQYLGELIMMLSQMMGELTKFFATFGIVVVLFLMVGRFLGSELKNEMPSFFQVFLDLFNAMNGNQNFADFSIPEGQIYIAIFLYIFKVLLMSLLAAQFINKYKEVYTNLDAYKRFNIIKMKNSNSYDKFIGGATIGFYPINILALPVMLVLMVTRSQRASDFMLKLQYSFMLLLYGLIVIVMMVPATPILYLKLIANSIYICIKRNRQDYKCQNYVWLAVTVFAGPLLIIGSFIGDLLTLPNTLFKPGQHFEHKYQISTENLTFDQMFQVTGTLARIFENYYQKFRGFAMTLGQLMSMHIRVFEIIENLHNLTCIGSKDYKEALSNVQDFNATKLLSEKCSIPARSGIYSASRCEIDQIHYVSADIRLYNYIDIILRKLRLGTLHSEMREKMNSADDLDDYVPNKKQKDKLQEAKQKKKDIEAKMVDNDGELSDSNFQEGMMPFDIGPDGVALKRNPSDIMNNMFIDIVSKSYTDIDQGFSTAEINKGRRGNKMEKEITDEQMVWKELLSGVFQSQADKFGREVKDQIYTMKLHRKRKENKDSGGQRERTQSTTSDNNLDFIN